jgi:hypothetical protein
MEIALGILGGLAAIAFALWLGFVTTQRSTALAPYKPHQVVPYEPIRMEPVKPIADPNSSVLMQGLAQQISSLNVNEAVDIEHTLLDNGGQRVRFARVAMPPLVRPMLEQPRLNPANETKHEKELKRIRKAAERVAESINRGGAPNVDASLNVDGLPCMLKKTADGYDLMLIKPDGSLQFMAHLGARS